MQRLIAVNVNDLVPHSMLSALPYQPADISEEAHMRGIYPTRHYVPLEVHRDRLVAMQRELDALLQLPYAKRWEPAVFERIVYLEEAIGEVPMQLIDQDVAVNLVPDVAARHALDNWLAGSAYSTTGPYMFLISSTSWSAVANADTMTSHAGWLEAGTANTPTYGSGRKTMVWSAASTRTKALSAALNFTFTGAGTVKGCGMVLGTGAVSTVDNTGGTLGSAGTFTGGDKVIGASGDALAVSYSILV